MHQLSQKVPGVQKALGTHALPTTASLLLPPPVTPHHLQSLPLFGFMGHLASPTNNNLQVILQLVTENLFFILLSLLRAAPGAEFPPKASFVSQRQGWLWKAR